MSLIKSLQKISAKLGRDTKADTVDDLMHGIAEKFPENNVLIVTLYNDNTLSHTFDEIYKAYIDRYFIVLKEENGLIYNMGSCDEESIQFKAYKIGDSGSYVSINVHNYILLYDNDYVYNHTSLPVTKHTA